MLNQFQNFLSSIDGIQYSKDNENTISFEYRELKYIFIFDESDPFYFRLILPNFFEITENNKQLIYEIINQLNETIKVIKAVANNNFVWASVEQFVYSQDKIEELFKRSIMVLEVFISNFRKEIGKVLYENKQS